jgi:hypothetical protein
MGDDARALVESGQKMPRSGEGEWHTIVRGAVRECVQTWKLQSRTGPVSPKAKATILSRATVLLMRRLDGQPPHVVVALLPGLLRTMLSAFLDVVAEDQQQPK